MKTHREITRAYFDRIARDWFRLSYDPAGTFLTFPTGRVRQDIVISEIKNSRIVGKAVDLGCGTGQLVIEMLRHGYDSIGIDNSQNMISEARKALSSSFPGLDGSTVFRVGDALTFSSADKYDAVSAMGLVEYLPEDLPFFKRVVSLLKKGGYGFVECRNKLFNISSGNQYTLQAATSGELDGLIGQLDRVERYSPASTMEATRIQAEVFGRIGKALRTEPAREAVFQKVVASKYPRMMVRRQHTPEELESVLKKAGLKLRYVVYYHCHPYLPRYEALFPSVFNKIGFLMQPLGYTSLGSTICSAFVAVLQK